MKKIIIDGSRIKDKESLYEVFQEVFEFSEKNLESIYQNLVNIQENTQLTFLNVQAVKSSLGNYGGSLMKMVEKAEKRNPYLKVRLIFQAPQRKFHQEKEGKNVNADRTINKKKQNQKPGCPYAGQCGGCDGVRRSYEEECAQKQKYVEKLLGKLTNVDELVPMEHPFHYRHKVHAVFSYDKKGKLLAGVYKKHTHQVIDIQSCLIENEQAGAIIRTIKEMMGKFRIKAYDEDLHTGIIRHVLIRKGYATGEILVVLVTGTASFPAKNAFVRELIRRHPEITSIVQNINGKKTTMVLGKQEHIWYGKGYIEDELCGKRFRISPRSFYQVNPQQTELLYRTAIECAGLKGTEKVIDAYCGTGTIGIVAADYAGQVMGVELNEDAIRDARINMKMNAVDNIRFYQGDAGKFMIQLADKGEQVDVVFMDPPRSGSSEEFLQAIEKLKPEKVVYISCNPETLARDMLSLMKMQYQVKNCKPVDLFPWTTHCECVILMTRCGFEKK